MNGTHSTGIKSNAWYSTFSKRKGSQAGNKQLSVMMMEVVVMITKRKRMRVSSSVHKIISKLKIKIRNWASKSR